MRGNNSEERVSFVTKGNNLIWIPRLQLIRATMKTVICNCAEYAGGPGGRHALGDRALQLSNSRIIFVSKDLASLPIPQFSVLYQIYSCWGRENPKKPRSLIIQVYQCVSGWALNKSHRFALPRSYSSTGFFIRLAKLNWHCQRRCRLYAVQSCSFRSTPWNSTMLPI